MGKPKYIYFEDRVIEYLNIQPTGTVSSLINGLLKEHIRKTELTDLTEEELMIELTKERIMTKAKLDIKELTNG